MGNLGLGKEYVPFKLEVKQMQIPNLLILELLCVYINLPCI